MNVGSLMPCPVVYVALLTTRFVYVALVVFFCKKSKSISVCTFSFLYQRYLFYVRICIKLYFCDQKYWSRDLLLWLFRTSKVNKSTKNEKRYWSKQNHIDTSTCNILNSGHNIKTFYCENVKKKCFCPFEGYRSAFFFWKDSLVWK